MSTRARAVSMTAMWTSVLFSLTWLRASGRLSALLTGIIVGVAVVGTVAILLFRRAPRAGAVARESCSS
jgi:tetrahydromethanopterin S-methyltransferase subunit B